MRFELGILDGNHNFVVCAMNIASVVINAAYRIDNHWSVQ